jgi:hypothetical protein
MHVFALLYHCFTGILVTVRFYISGGNDNIGYPAFAIDPVTGVFTLISVLLYASSPHSIPIVVSLIDDNTAQNPIGTVGNTTLTITANVRTGTADMIPYVFSTCFRAYACTQRPGLPPVCHFD